MIDWPLALSTASQAIRLARELSSVDKEVSEAELKLKVADLTTALADLKMTLTDARSDAAEKDEEIARLKTLQRRLAEDTVELYGSRCAADAALTNRLSARRATKAGLVFNESRVVRAAQPSRWAAVRSAA